LRKLVISGLLFLSACESASEPSGAVASAFVAAPLVAVKVELRGQPQAGAQVGFHAADGSAVGFALTGPDGVALGEVPEGGQVTVGVVEGEERFLTTVVGVAADDSLLVEVERGSAGTTAAIPLRFATTSGVASTQVAFCPNQYFVDPPSLPTGAPAAANNTILSVPSHCLNAAGKANLMVVGKNASGEIVAFGGRRGIAPGTPLGSMSPIPLFPPVTAQLFWQNLPAPVDGDLVYAYMLGFWMVDGINIGNGYAEALAGPGETATASMKVPADRLFKLRFYQSAMNGFVAQLGFDPRSVAVGFRLPAAEFPGPPSADFATALPAIDSVSVVASPLAASWTTLGSLDCTDGGRVQIRAPHWRWDVVVPPGALGVTFPELPAEMAGLAPPAGEVTVTDVFFLETNTADDYAELRSDWFRHLALDPTSSFRFSESSSF
jgi:hypothetical protein